MTTEVASPATAEAESRAPGPSSRRWRIVMILSLVAIVIVGAFDLTVILNRTSGPKVSALSVLMGLGDFPGHKLAPDFTLVDQKGNVQSLSSMRGKVVVLQFMDPHCTDICPIVSQELLYAYRDLGTAASQVAFVAVNVNAYATTQADVAAFSREHGLSSLPDWYFLTGPVPTLTSVWAQYGIVVDAPSPTADVIHSSYLFFIGKSGVERFLATPYDDHTKSGQAYLPQSDLTAWGAGIASVIRRIE